MPTSVRSLSTTTAQGARGMSATPSSTACIEHRPAPLACRRSGTPWTDPADDHIGEAAHARGVRWEDLTDTERLAYQSSYTYWQFRIPVANALAGVRCFEGGGEKAPIEEEMGASVQTLVALIRGEMLKTDKRFFAEVFGAKVDR